MIHREALRLSVRSLTRRPAESLLLIVSVALAVAATAAGVTLAGAGATISERLLASLQYREIVVSNGIERWNKSRDMKLPARPTLPNNVVLTAEDLRRARSVSPAVQYAYLTENRGWPLDRPPAGPRPQRPSLNGMEVTTEFFAARGLAPAAGSLFTDADAEGGEPVMVLGSWRGATLFEDGEAVGRTIWSDDRPYRIVGVLARSGTPADTMAFTPPGVTDHRLSIRYIGSSLRFTVADRRSLDAAREQLTRYFDAAYGDGLLHVNDPGAEARLIAGRFRGVVRSVLFLSASLLAVSTLYLANIFAGRALRKRRSAGILKAMGATAGGVFAVFAVEAAVIAAIGGAIGLGVAALLASDVSYRIGVEVSAAGPLLAGLGLSLTIVAACSLLPAAAAARAPAAEAIRYE